MPGAAAKLFQAVAGADINVDMVVQNISLKDDQHTDISFLVPQEALDRVPPVLADLQSTLAYEDVIYSKAIGKLSVVGAGIRSHTGAYATVFKALADAEINIQMISATEIRISVVMNEDELETAAQTIHRVFRLDSQRDVEGTEDD